jgi:thymidine phosphorylase
MNKNHPHLHLKDLGIDTYKEPVIYMRKDCHICRSEGFAAQSRVQVTLNNRSVIATLNTIESELLCHGEASLSRYAWDFLSAKNGDEISIAHPKPIESLSDIRSKIYGHELSSEQINHIVNDIVAGQLSDIHIATFLTATAGGHLSNREVFDLTTAMVGTGQHLTWPSSLIVDKHCVGGLPGNRTTLIVVPIVAAFGLMIPKTSSRAITSPAGTADTMEVLAPVDLDLIKMQHVVERESGCIVWGGTVALSPADDILIQIERAIDLDSEGQLVASVLSKKIAAGSTHLLIDIPVGPTAKVRSIQAATQLKELFDNIATQFGMTVKTIYSDGSQPVGRGIGPALEAQDVLQVLQGDKRAPQDLRDRALTLAGHILEFSPTVEPGQGKKIAKTILDSGKAWHKFQAICDAQGGMRDISKAPFSYDVVANNAGNIIDIDNRYIARIAKLAGAPNAKTAGVFLHVSSGQYIERNQPLFTVYAESEGELNYALLLLKQNPDIVQVGENK